MPLSFEQYLVQTVSKKKKRIRSYGKQSEMFSLPDSDTGRPVFPTHLVSQFLRCTTKYLTVSLTGENATV